ncbi:MAG: NYN domain-containing protein [Candidatus Omnitrophica bacterium]|nr:NYN domain-containing protein [Candidatus Omnitrophota bacterium]
MITVVLDGYNVIHAIPALARELDRSLQAAREALVRLCREYRARRGDVGRLYVVFDGADAEGGGPREDQHGVTVLFTRHGEEADERIVRLIREGGRSRFVVVSNDAQIANNARAHGARTMSGQEFYGQMKPARIPRTRRLAAAEKSPLPAREAERVTEEYRKHLERKYPT